MNKDQALRTHKEAIVIDGLNASYFFDDAVLQRIRQGGVTAFNGTVAAWHSLPETMNLIADYYRLFEDHADWITQVRTVEDIHKAKVRGLAGMIFGLQNTGPIDGNLRMLAVYHALGVRIIQLTYNDENAVGFGCMAPEDKGPDALRSGRGGGDEPSLRNPSGSVPLRSQDHDGWLSRLPKGLSLSRMRILLHWPKARETNRTRRLRPLRQKVGWRGWSLLPAWLTHHGKAGLEDYLNAIDYLVNLMGIDHVGLGTDFMEEIPAEIMVSALKGISAETGPPIDSTIVNGFESAAEFPKVTEGLLSRGYSPEDA